MKKHYQFAAILILCCCAASAFGAESKEFADKVIREHGVTGPQADKLRKLLTKRHGLTRNIGTEDETAFRGPNNSYHPVTRAQCRTKVLESGIIKPNKEYEKVCGAKWMAPIPDAEGKTTVCIDQFEFPNIPCEYPVVWVPSNTAHQICQSMGKRVCNAHEWEGGCAGELYSIESYRFDLGSEHARRRAINANREKVWAFQFQPELAETTDTRVLCGVYSSEDSDVLPEAKANIKGSSIAGISKGCVPHRSAYKSCGTNTWPAGYKFRCRSSLDVYDMHGNVAEVVNLPSHKGNIAKGAVTGFTERKGSFFVDRSTIKRRGVAKYPDDCRVRQPYEHKKEIRRDTAHSFYQEGFRCCKDVP
jgi:formylglycine-generating enzyme required for sulfatase activity